MKNVPSTINDIKFGLVDSDIMISSKEVADKFDKEHKRVMQSIREFECSEVFHGANFVHVEIITKNAIGGPLNKSHYDMTRDGFLFLAMGFTGKKAAKWKEDVINAFNQMEAFIKDELARREERLKASMLCPDMTLAIKEYRADLGKDTKIFHYTNEMNLINRIVLGATAKQYRKALEIDDDEALRDSLSLSHIEAIQNLQTANTVLIDAGLEYADRKAKLEKIFKRKFEDRCLADVLLEHA